MGHGEPTREQDRGLLLIAGFKILKGLALIAVGIGAVHLLHKDLAEEVMRWVDVLRIDSNNRYVNRLLEKVANVDEKKLLALSLGTFCYAGLFLCEGIGLALRQRWAEYLTIVTTASLMPIEVFEIYRKPSAGRVIVLLINVVVVWYLVNVLRKNKNHSGREAAAQAKAPASQGRYISETKVKSRTKG
jgi:uncharacterized membrane protein (DUF2068 family)